MNDWVVETPSFEEDLMNNRVVMLNQNGVNRVVEIIKEKDKEIERLHNIIKEVREKIKNHLYAKTILSDMYSDNEIFEFILEKIGDIDEQR